MDKGLAAVAEAQHGLLARWQVVGSGARRATVDKWLDGGELVPAAVDVYRVAGAPRTWEQRVMAVVLSAGPGAAASHRSAAALLGIPGVAKEIVEVSTHRALRNREASVHSSRVLPAEHLTVVNGIPTTRVARTVFDLASVLHPMRVERAVDSLLASGALDLDSLRAVVRDIGKRGRTGTALMRRVLDAREPAGPGVPASELEARFVALMRQCGLPVPACQLDLGDGRSWIGRVDAAYPKFRLVVELDGRCWHDAKLDLEADQRRDQRLCAAGWRVIRLRWQQLTERSDEVVDLMRRLLSQPAA